jgi:hypothetical protein
MSASRRRSACRPTRRSVPVATWKQSWRTTPTGSANFGSTTITHPFHPLKGQQCLILEIQRSGSTERLVLRTPEGLTLFVPLEWTDSARPSLGSDDCGTASRIEALSLLKVSEIVRRLLGSNRGDVDKS